ncbi:iron-sulfur cluster assembly scaffold protein [Acidobacteriota bacterium]
MPKDDTDLEKFTRELQVQIMEKIQKRYTQTVIDHWQNPRHFCKIENPDGYAKVKGPCGDTMEMFVKTKEGIITECAFQTDGCGTTIVCGSIATELAKDKSFTQALATVSSDEILAKLGGLPETDVHCASLAAETLRSVITDCLNQKRS